MPSQFLPLYDAFITSFNNLLDTNASLVASFLQLVIIQNPLIAFSFILAIILKINSWVHDLVYSNY